MAALQVLTVMRPALTGRVCIIGTGVTPALLEDSVDARESPKKSRATPGFFGLATTSALNRLDVGSLLPLGPRGDFERHLLAFLQRLESRHVDRREMREEIFSAAIGSNETKAFGVVKPLYSSCCHVFQFLKTENNRVEPGRCFDLKDRKVRRFGDSEA